LLTVTLVETLDVTIARGTLRRGRSFRTACCSVPSWCARSVGRELSGTFDALPREKMGIFASL
jgi:hypothetical protein